MYEQSRTAVRAQRRGSARAHNSDLHVAPDAAPQRAGDHAALIAGHLAALISATEEVRHHTGEPGQRAELDAALEALRARLAELAPAGTASPQIVGGSGGRSPAQAHDHAHALAGRLLVVAAAQQDTATAVLACRRLDAHAAARLAR
jgi:hypothetical protein